MNFDETLLIWLEQWESGSILLMALGLKEWWLDSRRDLARERGSKRRGLKRSASLKVILRIIQAQGHFLSDQEKD